MFDFGQKKVIGVNYSRYISLPKAWLNAMEMDVHSLIHVRMNDRQELVLTPAHANRQVDTCAGEVDTTNGGCA